MSECSERRRAGTPPDIVRSAYAELIVTDLGRARAFWVELLGFVVSAEEPDALYLRGYEEFVHHSLILRTGPGPACGRIGFRVRTPEDLDRAEAFYPLRVRVCEGCFLVQLQEYVTPAEIFTEYAYFSSYSTSWLQHARDYTDMAAARFGLGPASRVVEIASNDGYLLQYFVEKGIPVLGVEPAANVAKTAVERGVPTVVRFFGKQTAADLAADPGRADLIVGNNVLAHVPDINDFVGGLKVLLAEGGAVTMEFPHLWRLMEENQFDTIYHEHFSYLSFTTVLEIFAAHGLRLFDVLLLDLGRDVLDDVRVGARRHVHGEGRRPLDP